MKIILTFCAMFCLATLQAQTLSTGHNFNNGVYQNLEDFKADKPSIYWDELDTEAHVNTSDYEVKFTKIELKDGKILDRSSIWGVAIDGVPFIRVNPYLGKARLSTNETDPQLFVRLQAVGKLCYFYFEGYIKQKVPITVYDPVTSIPLRTTEIEKDKQIILKKIMDFKTGKVYDYKLENFLMLIEDTDKSLYKTLAELPEEEAREKLYKSLFIYNDRQKIEVRSR